MDMYAGAQDPMLLEGAPEVPSPDPNLSTSLCLGPDRTLCTGKDTKNLLALAITQP